MPQSDSEPNELLCNGRVRRNLGISICFVQLAQKISCKFSWLMTFKLIVCLFQAALFEILCFQNEMHTDATIIYVTLTTYCGIEGKKGKKSTCIKSVKNERQRESHPWVTGFMSETSLTWTDRDLLERTQGLIVPSHPYFLVMNETFSDRKPCRLRGKCWNKKVHCHPSAQTQRKKEVC